MILLGARVHRVYTLGMPRIDTDAAVTLARERRAELLETQRRARRSLLRAVHLLTRSGQSRRQVATALGIAPNAVQKALAQPCPPPEPKPRRKRAAAEDAGTVGAKDTPRLLGDPSDVGSADKALAVPQCGGVRSDGQRCTWDVALDAEGQPIDGFCQHCSSRRRWLDRARKRAAVEDHPSTHRAVAGLLRAPGELGASDAERAEAIATHERTSLDLATDAENIWRALPDGHPLKPRALAWALLGKAAVFLDDGTLEEAAKLVANLLREQGYRGALAASREQKGDMFLDRLGCLMADHSDSGADDDESQKQDVLRANDGKSKPRRERANATELLIEHLPELIKDLNLDIPVLPFDDERHQAISLVVSKWQEGNPYRNGAPGEFRIERAYLKKLGRSILREMHGDTDETRGAVKRLFEVKRSREKQRERRYKSWLRKRDRLRAEETGAAPTAHPESARG